MADDRGLHHLRPQYLLRAPEFAAQGPLFGHAWQDGRADVIPRGHGLGLPVSRFRRHVESIRSLLHSQTGEAHRDRTAGFVLEVLSKAEESENQSLAALEPDLMTILRDALTAP